MSIVCVAASCSSDRPASSTPPAALTTPANPPQLTPVSYVIASDLPPITANLASVRPAETTRRAFEFAARHPEILKYIPCFCGCERGNHKANDDCFVGGRDASGKVKEWTTHGAICEVCIDVATMAMQMHNSGASVEAIRAAVEKRYENYGGGHTPTPAAPHGGTHQ